VWGGSFPIVLFCILLLLLFRMETLSKTLEKLLYYNMAPMKGCVGVHVSMTAGRAEVAKPEPTYQT